MWWGGQVGHALENDLAALRLVHTRVIDTGHLFPHPKVPLCAALQPRRWKCLCSCCSLLCGASQKKHVHAVEHAWNQLV